MKTKIDGALAFLKRVEWPQPEYDLSDKDYSVLVEAGYARPQKKLLHIETTKSGRVVSFRRMLTERGTEVLKEFDLDNWYDFKYGKDN